MRIRTVEFVGAIGRRGQRPPDSLPQVAIAGRSNVGKSSLINSLTGRKRIARVSRQPGKTREINFYRVDDTFLLVDLPGYGFARAPEELRAQWARLLTGFLAANERLVGVIVLLDCRRGVTPADRQLLELLADAGVPALYVLTKIDKLNRAGRRKAEEDVRRALDAPEDQVLATSARTGEGLDTLAASIFGLVHSSQREES